MTCRLGNLLRRHGVKKGDCVTIYMPPCPLAVASMLACARIGAAHNVVFAGFSADALAERIRDGETALPVNKFKSFFISTVKLKAVVSWPKKHFIVFQLFFREKLLKTGGVLHVL